MRLQKLNLKNSPSEWRLRTADNYPDNNYAAIFNDVDLVYGDFVFADYYNVITCFTI